MIFSDGHKLVHPDTQELVGIFQGYADTGGELWLTSNGIEACTFEGFTDDGWTQWSSSIESFINEVTERIDE